MNIVDYRHHENIMSNQKYAQECLRKLFQQLFQVIIHKIPLIFFEQFYQKQPRLSKESHIFFIKSSSRNFIGPS